MKKKLPYDEEIERTRSFHHPWTMGGGGVVMLETCFPTDTDGLRVARPCPRCGGSVLAEDGELRCINCSCQVCRCGREMLAGWCRECQGEPVVLKSKRAGK